MSERTRVTIYLDSDLVSDIKELAEADDRSLAKYLERIILGSEEFDYAIRDLRREQAV